MAEVTAEIMEKTISLPMNLPGLCHTRPI